jgi:hypothetical protein
MTESKQGYKFGTWYQIEELTVELGPVIFYQDSTGAVVGILKVEAYGNGKTEKLYMDVFETGYYPKPSHFMPLPPRPGDQE